MEINFIANYLKQVYAYYGGGVRVRLKIKETRGTVYTDCIKKIACINLYWIKIQ